MSHAHRRDPAIFIVVVLFSTDRLILSIFILDAVHAATASLANVEGIIFLEFLALTAGLIIRIFFNQS